MALTLYPSRDRQRDDSVLRVGRNFLQSLYDSDLPLFRDSEGQKDGQTGFPVSIMATLHG